MEFKCGKINSNAYAFFNCVFINNLDALKFKNFEFVKIRNFYYKFKVSEEIKEGFIGLSQIQRSDLNAALNEKLIVTPFNDLMPIIKDLNLVLDFKIKNRRKLNLKEIFKLTIDIHKLDEYYLSLGQHIIINFEGSALNFTISSLTSGQHKFSSGKLTKETKIHISDDFGNFPDELDTVINNYTIKANETNINEIADEIERNYDVSPIFYQSWDFEKLGVGGISKEFEMLFRRAFASRVYSPKLIKEFGIKHVKGILLHGPPGCGKTLLARKLSQMLSNAKNTPEPIIINGPELLSKYVGESESNVRLIFKPAEDDYRRYGDKSPLHTIIFDEIDAIAIHRGTRNSGTGTDDKVLNQLLTKIDGLKEINNILIIGMTNRPDMLDPAIIRPGRLEIKIEIGLPDKNGRLEILKIHTSEMVKHNKLERDVNFEEISENTKNFTGAEIEGLVKNATSYALNKFINPDELTKPMKETEKIKVSNQDFINALNECKPAFGQNNDEIKSFLCEMNIYNDEFNKIFIECNEIIEQIKNQGIFLYKILLHGPKGCGKTSFVCNLSRKNQIPMTKILKAEKLIGQTDSYKLNFIKDLFSDLYKSDLSILILDDLERILEYIPLGFRYCNITLQCLLTNLKIIPPKNHKLLVFITSDNNNWNNLGFDSVIDQTIEFPLIKAKEISNIINVEENNEFREQVENIQGVYTIKNVLTAKERAKNSENFTEAFFKYLK